MADENVKAVSKKILPLCVVCTSLSEHCNCTVDWFEGAKYKSGGIFIRFSFLTTKIP